jgi:hypothetical protein
MPRGSKPNERRGGRKPGTPNKKTVLRKALINLVAADPQLLPLDFFLRLMRQSTLPLDIRVQAAEEALPFMHAKPRRTGKPEAPLPQDGGSAPRVKLRRKTDVELNDLDLGPELQDGPHKSGDTDGAALLPGSIELSEGVGQPDFAEPSVQQDVTECAQQGVAEPAAQHGVAGPVVQDGSAAPALQPALAEAAKAGDGERPAASAKALTPLAFLRAVMRHSDTPIHLRMKVASIIAPYFHPRAIPEGESEPEFEIDDQYGFSVEPALLKKLRDTKKALDDLDQSWTKGEGSYEQQHNVLMERLAVAKKSLRCADTYGWEDLAKDESRLVELAPKRRTQALTPAEDAEEIHLTARTFSHENSAEHVERERLCDRLDELHGKWKYSIITGEEQEEFDSLRARLRNIVPDPVSRDFYHQVSVEARTLGRPEPTQEEADKMLAAKETSADIVRNPERPPNKQPDGPEDVNFVAWLCGEVSYQPWLLRKAAYARYGMYHDAEHISLMIALVRDKELVLEEELYISPGGSIFATKSRKSESSITRRSRQQPRFAW